MAVNTISPITSLTITAGMNSAYTAPSATGTMIRHISMAVNTAMSAGSSVSAYMLVGPTGAMKMWLPTTGLQIGTAYYQHDTFIALSASGWGVVISANSGGVLDVYMAGIRITQ